jgi:site-specific DNA-methyltransferase (adenine-specific)
MIRLLTGDCEMELAGLADESVALVVTSPPYADARKNVYGGVHPDKYVAWFLPKAEQLRRVLRPNGTFILNVREKVVDCERHTYVIELIRALRTQGWLWTEQWIWHKRTSMPGKWRNRFRDAWEHCLQFNKERDFLMNQDAVMIPIGDWAVARMANLSDEDKRRRPSDTESGFARKVANWKNRDRVYPTNVLHLATECGNKKHSAAFPLALPEFFIKLFTEEGDTVLDPFCGSGTTGVAAVQLGRDFVGVDTMAKYIEIAKERIAKAASDQASVKPAKSALF